MESFLRMGVYGSLLIIGIFCFRDIFFRQVPRRFMIFLWLLVPLRLLVPFSVPVKYLPEFMKQGQGLEIQERVLYQKILLSGGNADLSVNPAAHEAGSGLTGLPIANWLFFSWLVVAVILAFVILYQHVMNLLKYREAIPATGEEIVVWQQMHRLKRHVRIKESDRVNSPVTYGIFRPVILLPSGIDFEQADLYYVLEHEWIHIKRYDVMIKYLICFSAVLYWFNPLVWFMCRAVDRDLELACDEAVLQSSSEEDRKRYAQLLLFMAERHQLMRPMQAGLTGYAEMEERIKMILNFKKYSWKAPAATALMILCAIPAFIGSPQEVKAQEKNEVNTQIISQQTATGEQIAEIAKKYVGSPYQYGGSDLETGVDCTGFVKAVYSIAGTQIPSSMEEQVSIGTAVSEQEIRAGDLVFYSKENEEGSVSFVHTAIYTGFGKVIHASNAKEGVKESKLDYREIGKIVRILN